MTPNVGIVSYGAYIPYPRLKRSAIQQVLGVPASKGERSVASFDEDSISMAVEAGRDAIRSASAVDVRSVYFASSTAPYAEKLNAATVAAAVQLPVEVRAIDLGGSIRSGLLALLQAADSARCGSSQALATMADCRLGAPEGKAEQAFGDAAAAFLLGAKDVIAEIVGTASITREFLDTWRNPDERFAHTWEERFALTQVYVPLLGKVIQDVLSRAGLTPADLASVVIDAPNPRAVETVCRSLKLTPNQIADPPTLTVGHSGAAHAGLLLANTLTSAKAGDLILVVAASDGADAALFRVTENATKWRPHRSVGRLIETKGDVSYASYLKWRKILPTEPPRRPNPERPAAPPMLRTERWKFGLVGSRCTACGTSHLPPQRVCASCHARDQMEPVSFADQTARIATFALDRLAYSLNPPTVAVVIDFDGSGRFFCEMTDCDPERIAIGDEVEMTFRRMFTADGVHNYFWKARPKR